MGAEDEELLLESEAFVIPVDWSLDGRFIVYMDTSATDVGVLPVGDGDERTPRPILESAAAEINLRLSPDDHWLAYESNESGTWEVWLQSFPELETKIQVSRGGGSHPEWRRDGKELFYLAPDRSLMAVELTGDDDLQPGTPQALFSSRALGHVGKQNYDLSPDGQRFLMIVAVGEAASSPITVNSTGTRSCRRG